MEKNRPLYIFKYLWDKTDEAHPATIADIMAYLQAANMPASRKTVAADILALQNSGFDVVSNKSRQNQYFVGSRYLEPPEVKLLVDAVSAAKFISQKKSLELIVKLSEIAGPYQSEVLTRKLYVDGKAKTHNELVYYIVDLLHNAIHEEQAVRFRYFEYTADKQKIFKHDGQVYEFSPYDLIWNNDSYYVFGWSESHGKIIKFRIDRMEMPKLSRKPFQTRSSDYDINEYCKQVFSMYDGKLCKVRLLCENSLMKSIVDRFGESVQTKPHDDNTFIAEVDISASPTFYAWVFTYGNKIKITAPKEIVTEYQKLLKAAMT